MKKRIIPIVVLVTVIIVVIIIISKAPVIKGEIEGTTYSHFCEVSGKIVEMKVELGSPVKKDSLIAKIDNTDMKYNLQQLEINLEKRRLALNNLLKGYKNQEIEKARSEVSIARASYRSAEANLAQAHNDFERITALFEAGGVTQNDLEKAELGKTIAIESLEIAKNQTRKAEEQLSLLLKGMDEETIAIANQEVLELESKINQTKETLEKFEIKANVDGVVISLNYNLGSIVNFGYNIADISAENEKYVVCYFPEKYSHSVNYGQEFYVSSGKKEYLAPLKYIDVKSQYTPKEMQSKFMKNKVSVRVKLLLPKGAEFKVGAKVKVEL